MNTIKVWKCGVCGALVDQATGETHVGKNSNAFKFKTLEKDNLRLKEDLKKLLDQNERLKEGLEDEPDKDSDGSIETGSEEESDSEEGSGSGEGSDILDDIIG